MDVSARVVFHGRVQGVNFRANCRLNALELGLTGWVQNRADGAVEAIFEGEQERVQWAIEWNKKSQPHARVSHVEVSWLPASRSFATFAVKR